MNRRRLFIALALTVPLVIFVVAKMTASWRPVKVAVWKTPRGANVAASVLDVSERYVSGNGLLLDLKTGSKQATHTFLVGPNAWTWQWLPAPLIKNRLVLKNAGQEVVFRLPSPLIAVNDWLQVRVFPQLNSVEALYTQGFTKWDKPYRLVFCRWDLDSLHLQQTRTFSEAKRGLYAIGHDGQTIIRTESAPPKSLSVISTQSGQTLRRVVWPHLGPNAIMSGRSPTRFFVVADMINMASSTFRVMDASTGRELYQFRQSGLNAPQFFSPDEKLLCLAIAEHDRWEIRDAQTGQIIRTLPLAPKTQSGAFSPDGATLYSVANGVLYRQRAR